MSLPEFAYTSYFRSKPSASNLTFGALPFSLLSFNKYCNHQKMRCVL